MQGHPHHPPLFPHEIERMERQADAERLEREQERERERERTRQAEAKKPAVVEAPPNDLHRERFVSLERAQELCSFAWRTVEFNTGQHGNGEPNLSGNCVGKARWLQRHLGGILIEGYRKDREKTGRHAALLFASEGKLYAADWGEIVPIDEYQLYICGFST